MNVKQNSLKAWVLASRPKTLVGALVPVAVASALSLKDGGANVGGLVVCFAFAALMQVAANLINDLFDYTRGSDREDRLGPERACAQGWITPAAMRVGIMLTLFAALAVGCTVLWMSSLWLIAVGAVCVLFAFLYTTILSYTGMGDLLVVVFFGLVPTMGSYFVATGRISLIAVVCSLICGILIDTLLIINNYRDFEADRLSRKRTLIVLFGLKFGGWFYLLCGLVPYLMTGILVSLGCSWWVLLTTLYVPLHLMTWRQMLSISKGRELNRILGQTSRNMLVFGLLLSLGILL